MPGLSNLKTYQFEAVDFLDDTPFGALWLDLGLGKTVSVLTLLARLFKQCRVRKVLIVAPLRVALQTWPTEIQKWDHTRHLTFTVIRTGGSEPSIAHARHGARTACKLLGLDQVRTERLVGAAGRAAEVRAKEALLHQDTQIHIVNQEALPWLKAYFRNSFPYDTLIFDESSGLRDPKSTRYRAMMSCRKYVTRMHQMTGTPAPEGYVDLFTQVFLMDQGERFGANITAYRDQYFIHNSYSKTYTLKPGAANEIIGKLSGIVLEMKARDYLPARDVLYIDRPISLSKTEYATYKRLEDTFLLELSSGEEIEAETAPALAWKLLQYASGAVYDTDRNWHLIHNHKIEELRQIIEESQGKPIIVAYWFKSTLARLKVAFPNAKAMDREGEMQHPWNAGKIDLLFMHPRSGGHGLNLQAGGAIIVWFDICYPLENYLQLNGRLDRQGQTEIVKIFHLWVRGTLDQTIVPKLIAKEKSQDYLFRRLRQLRQAATKRVR